MWLHEIEPGTKEADALARRLLTSLYTIAARDKGYELESITIHKKGEQTPLNRKGATS